jgi:hypothetical protein
MSDELKLQLIKNEVDNLMMCIKMQITIQTTIEAYRQYVTGELPSEFNSYVESDDFKHTFDQAVKAGTEVLQNLITFASNVGVVFGVDFRSQVPSTPEEHAKMAQSLYDELNQVQDDKFNWQLEEDK